VNKWEASLDGAGIIADIASIVVPGPGEIVQAGVTFVELVVAGNGILDLVFDGDPSNVTQELVVAGTEQNLRLLARSTRWIPLVGTVASGYSLYRNFDGRVHITEEYR
jgi:hypothetical protein